jgi:hypothetical protein
MRVAVSLFMIASVMACGDRAPSAPTSNSDPVRLVAASALVSEGVVGTTVPGPRVLVVDSRKRPMRGIPVRFSVIAGAGSIEDTLVTTLDDGIADAGLLTLGTQARTNIVSAITSDIRTPLQFYVNARPGAPAALKTNWKYSQLGFPGSAVWPPAVSVVDNYGNGIARVRVSFAGTDGLDPGRVVNIETGPDGSVQAGSWTLGPTPGTYVVTATSSGVTPMTFTALAVDPRAVIATYELDTINDEPPSSGLSSQIALTSDGQFIEDTRWPTSTPLVNSGTYTVRDSTLTFTFFWGRHETADFYQSSLVRHFVDDYYLGLQRWVYLKRGPQTAQLQSGARVS